MDVQQPSDAPESLSYATMKEELLSVDPYQRLGVSIGRRMMATGATAFGVGLCLGFSKGNTTSAYRFRAENAHRQPLTSMAWWQYHKTRRYVATVAGMREGFRMGSRLGGSAMVFTVFEDIVDNARHGQRDFLSTVVAGLSFSGIYSLLARHDVFTAARTAKLGLKLGLTYGLLQDGLAYLKGNPPAYVRFIMGKPQSKAE
ncbi:uncharacterized protein BO95DRAFT_456597 [Aspergillus brunneoviolaceus CBS 621.78]|uniref:Uncharacterized protein n=1 Tax=Aspergillus brunneoviolaceus CBS 621.78 TaxID=1450534 RepID=A0ACD1FWV8_9EURO|nr:hypothetical protein BO95DRAFT_456597 [Aspergillus brunneoviolaceus CBS 621.78]RAH41418.1 hypothetical protein BO95DRAFT_456597 [Aspergillus brunneoviolaceus CBS 621.78]